MEALKDEEGNPIYDEEGNQAYKHIYYDKPKKRKTYIDVAREEYNRKISSLQLKYHDVMYKALLNIPEDAVTEENLFPVMDLIRELLKNPIIIREIEKEAKAAQLTTLPPIGSAPTGNAINLLLRAYAQKNGRFLENSKTTREENITLQTNNKGKLRYIRNNRESTITIEISQADTFLQKTNKTFSKVFLFTLQKMTAQHFPLEVGFSLQELVDLGMYKTTSNAGRAVKDFFLQQLKIVLSGSEKRGKKVIKEKGGVLFYDYELNNGYVTLKVNDSFNMEFIAPYFTIFPRFAYALKSNAFSLVRYIFFLARQNTQAIKDKGTFTISLEAVRENLGLPSIAEVKNRKYRQFIIEPIEKAIEEVEEALQNVPEAKEYGFTITPHGTDTSNIKEWLQGYLEIGLNGDFAETFVRIAEKTERERSQWEKIKKAERAKIAAKEEAKETHTKKNK